MRAALKERRLRLSPAKAEDLAFARELTRANMREYYARYGLIWQPDAFDAQWWTRESYLVEKEGAVIGFLGLTIERGYLYVRDIQLIEAHRGEGVGAWVMDRVSQMARDRGCGRTRLKVFKSNPATDLYLRLGYTFAGEESALFWMERVD
ncbi:GNAT family N-acetyltransferase [Pseudomonas sp. NPDC088444]|uniref:GNAT family N-acetyltransferase n=1 Tax=Pseudomonas sp. NPDC088444 TaxID=3364456 RepID=UPI00384CAA23